MLFSFAQFDFAQDDVFVLLKEKLHFDNKIWITRSSFGSHCNILSVSEKSPVSDFRYFGKYIIKLYGYFYVHVFGQRRTGMESLNSSMSPGTMVYVMHVLFYVFFAVFRNLKSSFSEDNMPEHALDIVIENTTKMV